jgi:hypothetical protein
MVQKGLLNSKASIPSGGLFCQKNSDSGTTSCRWRYAGKR